jgi:hypothetical protein
VLELFELSSLLVLLLWFELLLLPVLLLWADFRKMSGSGEGRICYISAGQIVCRSETVGTIRRRLTSPTYGAYPACCLIYYW